MPHQHLPCGWTREQRLHTAQPSLSRQIRDLEYEVGAQPAKPTFTLGFLTGQEMDWLPEAMRILRDELPNIEVSVFSQYSPDLAQGLLRGKLDLAFMRPEAQMPDLEYRVVVKEPLIVAMPSDHRLASQERGVALLPTYAKKFLPWAVTARPLAGEAPTIELVAGYNRTNTSPILKRFLSRLDQLKKRAPQTP
jgi:LysR family transcriptional regulator, hca operon transcriptional activator